MERLAEGTARELTVVCAPAGFGKTSLLGDWTRRSKQPVAWLSLDVGDNDPVRFWRYVAIALDQVSEGVGGPVAALLRGPPPPLEAVVTALINALALRPDQVVLVLDDYHLIQAPPVHHSLGILLEQLPAQLQVVLVSRVDPPLPLARLRARGQLAELRAADLRFTSEETAVLLGKAMGLELPAGSLAAPSARTEGWVAGLQLAGLSLRGHADPAGFVATFSGSHRYVLDYLTEEVLAHQPERLVGFMLDLGAGATVGAAVPCGYRAGRQPGAAGGDRAGQPVPAAAGRGAALVALPPAVRRPATGPPAGERPERVLELHRAAAAWHDQQGLGDDAVRHALAAGDTDWAARLVERHADALTLRFEGATLQRWLAALPADLIRSRPRLCLIQAWNALIGGRVDEAEALVTQAERASDAAEPFEPSVGRERSSLTNIPAAIALWRADRARQRGDPERASVFARQSLASLTEADRATRVMVRWQLGDGGVDARPAGPGRAHPGRGGYRSPRCAASLV